MKHTVYGLIGLGFILLIPNLAAADTTAQETFPRTIVSGEEILVCTSEVATFVVLHVFKYEGTQAFNDALDFYTTRPPQDAETGTCGTYTGPIRGLREVGAEFITPTAGTPFWAHVIKTDDGKLSTLYAIDLRPLAPSTVITSVNK